MKSKLLLAVVIGLLTCVNSVTAQTNYYSTPQTFDENGYTYECNIGAGDKITLGNINNRYTSKGPTYVVGEKYGEAYVCKGLLNIPISKPDISRRLCHVLMKNVFTQEEKKRLRDDILYINMNINPQTGRVMEVYFEFHARCLYNTVPLSTYREIEVALMSNAHFIPSDTGKKLDFILYCWTYHLAYIIDD